MITTVINPFDNGTGNPEKVINGNFATDSDWNKDTGWTISGGKANCNSDGSEGTRDLSQVILDVGETYNLSLEIVSFVSGNLYLWNGSSNILIGNSVGIKNIIFTAGITTFIINASGGFVGSIDTVSVKETP